MRQGALVYDSLGLAQYCGPVGRLFVKQFFSEGSVMPDKRRGHSPPPVLRTRPATMLTAIGLCLFIVVTQLMPDLRGLGSRVSTNTDTVSRMPTSTNQTLPASAITR